MGTSTAAAGGLLGIPAAASMSRALTLTELVGMSRFALLGTPTDAQSTWESIGGRRRIVTYTTFRVDQPLDERTPESSEVAVRTLGGQVGDIGQIVHGEASLELGSTSGVFLSSVASGVFAVTGMAQGLYLVREDARGHARLRMTADVHELTRVGEAAVRKLHDRTLTEAARLIATELQKNER